jgi:hypothetical protein
LFGYGTDVFSAGPVVDNAYLGWLLAGGVGGLGLWIVGSGVVTPRLLWPALAAMFAIAMLANPFSGPTYAVFLSACGAVAAESRASDQVGRRRRESPSPLTSGTVVVGRPEVSHNGGVRS